MTKGARLGAPMNWFHRGDLTIQISNIISTFGGFPEKSATRINNFDSIDRSEEIRTKLYVTNTLHFVTFSLH